MLREGDPGYDDCFKPPEIPTEVGCLHCGESYDSYLIAWVEDPLAPGEGFWCCPTPGCDGKGFCFDIWPTDPDWTDENGEKVCWTDDDDEDYALDEDFEFEPAEFEESDDEFYVDDGPLSFDCNFTFDEDLPWTDPDHSSTSNRMRRDELPWDENDIPF